MSNQGYLGGILILTSLNAGILIETPNKWNAAVFIWIFLCFFWLLFKTYERKSNE